MGDDEQGQTELAVSKTAEQQATEDKATALAQLEQVAADMSTYAAQMLDHQDALTSRLRQWAATISASAATFKD